VGGSCVAIRSDLIRLIRFNFLLRLFYAELAGWFSQFLSVYLNFNFNLIIILVRAVAAAATAVVSPGEGYTVIKPTAFLWNMNTDKDNTSGVQIPKNRQGGYGPWSPLVGACIC